MWVRYGECNRCGDCCKGDPFDATSQRAYCPLFKWIAENVGSCTNRQHPYYLGGCADFPSNPQAIADKPNCSYRFEWVEEDASVNV